MIGDTPFEMDVRRETTRAVLVLRGSCTMEVSHKLRTELETLASEPIKAIVIDLADLAFIESGGLGSIIAAHVKCRRRKGQLRLVAPRPPILKMLQLTRLTEILPIDESVEAALRAVDAR